MCLLLVNNRLTLFRKAHIAGRLSPLLPELLITMMSLRILWVSLSFNHFPYGTDTYIAILSLDLTTLDANVETDKYDTVDSFVDDVNLIWGNCRIYNQDGSNYVKCANKLEKFFKERLKILRIEMKV